MDVGVCEEGFDFLFDLFGGFRSVQCKEAIGEVEEMAGCDVVRFFGFGDESGGAIEEDDVEVVAQVCPAMGLTREVDGFVGLVIVGDSGGHEGEVSQVGFECDLSDPGVSPSPLIEARGGLEFEDLFGEEGAFLVGFD